MGCREKMLSGHEIPYTWVGFVGSDVLGDLTSGSLRDGGYLKDTFAQKAR